MDHDDRGLAGAEMIWRFNNAARVVAPAPCAYVEVGVRIVHDGRRFPAIRFADWLNPFAMISQQRLGMFDGSQSVLVNARSVRRDEAGV